MRAALLFIHAGEPLLQLCFGTAVKKSVVVQSENPLVFCLFHKREKAYIAVENAG